MQKILLTAVFTVFGVVWGMTQIYLENASFEGDPRDATVPVGWHPCEAGTTPDILPGPWSVYLEASEGETFVGIITREDGSWESIGQRISSPLRPRECYSFKMDLAHSKTYAGYDQPLRLRVWGGETKCRKDQLLLETKMINNTDWETYEVQFYAKKTLNYIVIEAFYKDGYFSYKGNILIDNITPIKKCIRASLD